MNRLSDLPSTDFEVLYAGRVYPDGKHASLVMREAFERDYIGDGPFVAHTLDRSGDGYKYLNVNAAWVLWQSAWGAALASLKGAA